MFGLETVAAVSGLVRGTHAETHAELDTTRFLAAVLAPGDVRLDERSTSSALCDLRRRSPPWPPTFGGRLARQR